MLKFPMIPVIIFLLPTFLIGQEGDLINKQADSLFQEKAYDTALGLYKKGYILHEGSSDWAACLETGYQIALCFQRLGAIDSAIVESQKIIELQQTKQLEVTPLLGDIYHKLGVYFYINDAYTEAESAYQEAIKIRAHLLGENHLDLSRSHHNLGLTFFEKGNYEAAIEQLQVAIDIRKENDQPVLLAQSYQELGIIYMNSGDYNQGLEIQETAISLHLQEADKSYYDVARNYNVIGILHRKLRQFPEALVSLDKALQIFIDLFGEKDSDVANCYNNIGNVYDEMGAFDQALQNYKAALKINQELFGEQSISVSRNLTNMGYTLMRNQQLEEALNYHSRSLQIRQRYFKGSHPFIANVYDNIADVLVEQGKLQEALDNYQLALKMMFLDFEPEHIYENPSFTKHEILNPKTELLTFLSGKARTLKKRYEQKQNIDDLTAAYQTFLLCDKLIHLIRKEYVSETSTLFLLENAIPIYEEALEVAFLLQELEPSEAYIKSVFRLMENSKSVLLFSSRREDKAKWLARIPEHFLEQENDFKANIQFHQQLLQNLKLDESPDQAKIAGVQNKLLLLKQSYGQLIMKLEEQFPQYYDYKYRSEVLDINLLKDQLAIQNASFVEYFAGAKHLYILVVNPGNTHYYRTSADPILNQKVNDLISSIKDPSNANNEHLLYEESAYQVYEKIWKPIEKQLNFAVILVSDGILNYVPFEALLAELVDDKKYKQYPFLIKKYQLSYAYSAGVLLDNFQRNNRKKANSVFLGVAPVFEQSDHYPLLKHSKNEVTRIQNLFGGDLLIGQAATKQNFKAKAQDFGIVHISSHAVAEDANTLSSWIAFAEDSSGITGSRLYLSEIYNLKLHAEMVVLSACETGSGNLSRGEGVISLARGFALTGCQSMLTTLWAVNHSSSSQLMESFYGALYNSKDKRESLHNAKLAYLNNPQIDHFSAYPYYWSGYVLLGNTDRLHIAAEKNYWTWLILGLPLLFGVWLFFRKNFRV